MALDKEIEKELLEKVGKEATEATKTAMKEAEKEITLKSEEFKKGLMSEKSFEDFKKEQMDPIQKTLDKLEVASKEQGNLINQIKEKGTPNSISLEDFIISKGNDIKELREKGGFITYTGAELKAAGVNSIAGAIPTPSPYAPGPSGTLEIFDILRNPNFITSKVDLGRTDKSILAWANEIGSIQGSASADVAEGGLKPQLQHQFVIETSKAKKAAGFIEITDEFEQDLPQFASRVRRFLQEDVERAWDDAIQIDVQNKARPFNITSLNSEIPFANRWDAIMAFFGQVGFYNFIPNAVAINWITNVMLQTAKNAEATYLIPPFLQMVLDRLVYANKMQVGNALVGDLKQYHVDIYKDFLLKVGWINDDLIHNQFAIVGEMRYHNYIADARRNALVYDSLARVAHLILGNGSY